MSLINYVRTKEYIVTVKNFTDLDSIYEELETKGKSPPNVDLERSVQCVNRRPTSRNTHYLLTEWEAAELKNDPRVIDVTLAPSELGIKAGLNYTEQTSSGWDKSNGTSNSMRNWGLLRCTREDQITGWGGTGYQGGGTGTPSQTATISLAQTGKNVDVVVCDENGIAWGHPEFAVNSDGTGGTRSVQYNWFQHNAEIGNGSNGTYTYGTGGHSTHVAGTVAGTTQGWARNANIYNIYYDAGNTYPEFGFVFDYIRAFHRNKTTNVSTGRKNPTIVNNSWGMSIFPSEWSFSDITAVTYRGTRYTPTPGATTYTGYSGVCTANARLATLLGEENFGNRITTTGPYVPPSGSILTKPGAWSQTGQQAYLTQLSAPDTSYVLTIQGPADITLLSNVAVDAVSGLMSIEGLIEVVDSGTNIIQSYSDGPYTSLNGGTLEYRIEESLSLPNNEVYTVTFTNNITVADSNALYATGLSLSVVTESTPASATVQSITNTLLGAGSLTASTTPTSGNNDDGYWTLNLPFSIEFLGNSYSTIYVGTNTYITFGSGSSSYIGLGPSTPNLPKIMWSCADNSVQRIYYGEEGTAPNRTYRVRIEGNGSTTGTLGSPGMLCEYVFYENAPTQIDLQLGQNNKKTTSSGFTTEQLNSWGFISGQRIPARVSAMDADIEDAYAEGIVMVGAAGNGRWKHDVPGGIDWDNTFEMANRYPGSVSQPYYYMRGTSPTANDSVIDGGTFNLPAICVGSVDSTSVDQKVQYSDCGPGVDIWAPGTNIISSYTSGISDSRNSGYFLNKLNGTSMASPQVCGVLACAMEIYPHMNQQAAKEYILGYAKANKLTASSGGPADGQDLQGAPNLFLYYKIERLNSGNVFPKTNYKPRPTNGVVFPRARIRRTI